MVTPALAALHGRAADAPPSDAALLAAAARGRDFLAGLFDPQVSLLPEYRGARVYWLFHDNYLAAKVLARSHPELARKITAAVADAGVRESGKVEILFGEAKRPLPFRHYALREVKRVGDKVLKTEVTLDTPLQGWEAYADLRFLAALALAEGQPAQARSRFESGLALWDGHGFHDEATRKADRYATYKLALALLAEARLKRRAPAHDAVVEGLLARQSAEGGWITDYDRAGKPHGLANVETTSLALLALDTLAGAAR